MTAFVTPPIYAFTSRTVLELANSETVAAYFENLNLHNLSRERLIVPMVDQSDAVKLIDSHGRVIHITAYLGELVQVSSEEHIEQGDIALVTAAKALFDQDESYDYYPRTIFEVLKGCPHGKKKAVRERIFKTHS